MRSAITSPPPSVLGGILVDGLVFGIVSESVAFRSALREVGRGGELMKI